MADEFYPMPMFATLSVADVETSTRWYRDGFGFRVMFEMPGPMGEPSLTHLRWARYADLLLVRGEPAEPKPGAGVKLSFNVVGSTVDELAERARGRGVDIGAGPVDQPWNARELVVSDPDGYTIAFTQGPVDPSLTIDDIADRAAGSDSPDG